MDKAIQWKMLKIDLARPLPRPKGVANESETYESGY